MHKPRELQDEEVNQNPLLLDLLERARAGSESVLTYHGVTVAIVPVVDITHTFTDAALEEFAQAFKEAEDEEQRLTGQQVLLRHRQQVPRNG